MPAEPTKQKLANVLDGAKLPDLAAEARAGRFDDFESESLTPIVDLVKSLESAGRQDLADRARNGEWDGTREEAEAWYQREGDGLLEAFKKEGGEGI